MDLEKLVLERLVLGKERYGHGVRVDDDTTQFGTPSDSWMHMALEEHLDAVYCEVSSWVFVIEANEISEGNVGADLAFGVISEYESCYYFKDNLTESDD